MSTKIGRFEIVSQIAQSTLTTVYKAQDTESQQTVALKVLRFDQVKDRDGLIKAVFDEAEQSKPLSSHNIATLYGVGDEDGLLLAATEYVQGNSIATTLARKDGFSVWDLQDIARQICHALDHAQSHKVVHRSLEPAKAMVGWDGVVKLLGFGISAMNALAAESSVVPDVLHYASPEQVRGEPADHRSALFSLGAILYEMATEQKAFAGETPDQVRAAILEQTPAKPSDLKSKVNPGLSALIMKAISKLPDERYQSGQELVRDLEQCKPTANTLAALKTQAPQQPAPAKAKAQSAAASGDSTTIPGSIAKRTPLPSSTAASVPASQPTPVPGSPAPGLPVQKMSASALSTAEPPAKPNFAVDPMMEEDNSPTAAARKKFSDLNEMPPLREIYVAQPPPATTAAAEPLPQVVLNKSAPDKPKVQVREAAQKAVSEIRKTPPKLYMYALGGAVIVIALIVSYMTLHNYLEDRDQSASSATAPPEAKAQPAPSQPSTQPMESQPPAPESQIAQSQDQDSSPAAAGPAPASSRGAASRGKKSKSRAVATAGAPAQLAVTSNPAGAQITFDGSALCLSPCNLTGIAPGQHVVAASKPGYSSESRTLALASGANSSLTIELPQLSARMIVSSTPAGAVIVVDGKDTGKLTPSQLILDKPGAHTVVLRRAGYLEETSSTSAEAGQTANVNLVLKPLGSTDEIHAAGGKFKKVFGGGDTANMGIVSVKTQPKGAQIMVNNRVLDKTAPFEFYLNPGTYVLDISMSGYRGVHRVVNVERKEKLAIEENLLPE
jgi:serine/threonine-protein kinase